MMTCVVDVIYFYISCVMGLSENSVSFEKSLRHWLLDVQIMEIVSHNISCAMHIHHVTPMLLRFP